MSDAVIIKLIYLLSAIVVVKGAFSLIQYIKKMQKKGALRKSKLNHIKS